MGIEGLSSLNRLNTHRMHQELRMHSAATRLLAGSNTQSVSHPIADKLHVEAKGLAQGVVNSTLNSARLSKEASALDEGEATLDELRDLASQATLAGLTDADRAALNEEFNANLAHLRRELGQSSFNGKPILDGSTITVRTDHSQSFRSANGQTVLDILEGVDISSPDAAAEALKHLDTASSALQVERGQLNAAQAGMERAAERALSQASHVEEAAWSIGASDLAHDVAEFVAASSAHSAAVAVINAHNSQMLDAVKLLP
jgi:flagellin-like hook-associated protein FlgL